MEQNPNIPALANELAQAIEVIMNASTPQNNRMEAYIACEQFKEASPLCAQAGLYLASGHFSTNVKHFGLQLMEHTIKLKWNNISQEEKIFIKENAMKLLFQGVGPAEDVTLSHLKDALSRIIVEMIKREWPQQWTTLLSELSDACTKGEAQTELVLLIFLRLVEDVALLQTIESNQRRKDIYAALTSNMSEIFNFFLRLVELHVTAFREATSVGNIQKANAHGRVVQVVLLTLTGFVEWVSINHIMCGDGKLLHILCILLNDSSFQIDAAECLAQIVGRKGNVKDRKPLLTLYLEHPMNYIYQSAQTPPMGVSIEKNHAFLKKLNSVFNGLAQLITALWGKDEGTTKLPAHFHVFLEALFITTRHPSLTVAHLSALVWNILLKHDQMKHDPLILSYIPKLIQVVGPRIVKLSYPNNRSTNVTMTTESFISLEYDSEEEFFLFFHRSRTDFMEIFRQATSAAPIVTFSYCEQLLKMRLAKAHSETNTSCSVQDPVYLEWEALVTVLDGVLNRMIMVTERPSVASGLQLLEECLKVNTNDPVIISIILSCISALFIFLSMSSCQLTSANCVAMTGVSLLPRVLEKIFSALVYPFDDESIYHNIHHTSSDLQKEMEKYTKREAVKNLRRHAASLMVKLAIKYPILLLPVFDQINTSVKNFSRQAAITKNTNTHITKNTQITLNEALIIISNHFCDFERQSAFIAEVLGEAQMQWQEMTAFFKTPIDFINFVGLNKPATKDIDNDPAAQNRAKIIDSLNIVIGVLKRSTWPDDDPDRASRGGFVVGLTESGNPICRNPAASHVIPLLPNILALLRVLNELFKPEAINMISNDFKKTLALVEHEKRALMGIPPIITDPLDPIQKKPPTVLEKMQSFLLQIFDNCYHLMGQAGPSLGRDLYQLTGISDALINSAFSSLDSLPDYRLRPIIRVFLKPFVYSCAPIFYDQVLLPIFANVAPFMLRRLTSRWQYITALYESGELSEEISDTEEVLEDMLNRSLTREYLDIFRVALVGGTIGPPMDRNDQTNDVMMDQDELSMDGHGHNITRATQAALAAEVISELGGKLLKNPLIRDSIVMTILSAISWNDSTSSVKSVQLTAPIMRFLASEQLLTPGIANNALIAVLKGLQVHGQHETIQSPLITLGVQVYEISRPKFPTIIDVLQRIPNINLADLQKLDEKIATSQTKGNKIDKSKKDLFKKITSQLVNRSINQLFRHDIQIANLPPMNLSGRNRSENSDILNSTTSSNLHDSGLSKLFNNANASSGGLV